MQITATKTATIKNGDRSMKKTVKLLSIILCIIMILSTSSCRKEQKITGYEGIWESAIFTNDQEMGLGSTQVVIDIQTENKAVEFTIYTDSTTLYGALYENGLIEIASPKASDKYHNIVSINGIPANYDEKKIYWALYRDTVPVETLIEDTPIVDGEHYEVAYTAVIG